MLTYPELARRTNKRRKESAGYVKLQAFKKGWDSLGRGYCAAAMYSTHVWDPYKQKYVRNTRGPNGKPTRYVCVAIFLSPKLFVSLSCSCPDFRYRLEVSNNRKQAAEIEYSNGELPVIRNPTMRNYLCKHLYKLYERIAPELPKPKSWDKSPPISPPQIGTPPSERKKMEEQKRQQQQQKVVVQPATVSAPKNQHRSAKPGRKQSTLPRSMQNPVKKTQASVQPPLKNTVARRKR